MKRFGKKTLVKGMRVKYAASDAIYNESPKVINGEYGNVTGYITYDLFMDMLRDKTLVKDFGDYWYTEYVVQ